MPIFALADCNNFFASCERVFRPDLEGKPIAVLSNNDGCIIARSEEVKNAGIPMCAPVFKIKDEIKKHRVHLFSANFSLYGDMSHRVMDTIRSFTPQMEIYSIDEAFLSFDDVPQATRTQYAQQIQSAVKQWVGIPISIGIAPTKTLAKLANEKSKRHGEYNGVLDFTRYDTIDHFLHRTDICDIWGIGRKLAKVLYENGIYTALQLKQTSDVWMKKKIGIVGQRLVWELRGISCLSLEDIRSTKKGILSSRSFSRPIETLDELKEAVASYATIAAEKLREEDSLVNYVHVWIVTNRFKKDESQYSNGYSISLPSPTAYTPAIIKAAFECLEAIYIKGFKYKKASVNLSGLVSQEQVQLNMFTKPSETTGHVKLMKALDKINMKEGNRVVRFAAEGIERSWYATSSHRSPRYTTSWKEIPTVIA